MTPSRSVVVGRGRHSLRRQEDAGSRSRGVLAVALLASVSLAGCTAGGRPAAGAPRIADRRALLIYLGQVEPIRLGINRLLDGADPLLVAYRGGRISARRAGKLMGGLERRFAGYTLAINSIRPGDSELAAINRPYALTYVLEDAYLSALAAALPTGRFDALPNTQGSQRASIILWRTQLEILARRLGVRLPADLQEAGRGEIAPSPLTRRSASG